MAQKQIHVEEVGLVTLQKRKGAKGIRLTVAHDGVPRVSMPPWSPYHVGLAFVQSKIAWIQQQQIGKSPHVLAGGRRIGKAHRIQFIHEHREKVSTRLTNTTIIVRLPVNGQPDDESTQIIVRAAAVRALKQEAKFLLPQRLQTLAAQHNFTYRSVSIKQLKARWGSCSSQKDIALNCFLMQLPWELIDYVLLHELLHTQIMAHGERFWTELGKYVPNLAPKRKLIKQYQPALIAQD